MKNNHYHNIDQNSHDVDFAIIKQPQEKVLLGLDIHNFACLLVGKSHINLRKDTIQPRDECAFQVVNLG